MNQVEGNLDYEYAILPLRDGSVYVECGPMRLWIWASIGRLAQQGEALKAARTAILLLEEVAMQKDVLKRSWTQLQSTHLIGVGLEMKEAVSLIADEDLTPMAAVAGAIADGVADLLQARGMTRVIVENGGDIAIRLSDPQEKVKLGIRTKVDEARTSFSLTLAGTSPSWGVATSGLGGRSMTRGIAHAATAVSRRASLADAAATSIANSTWVPGCGAIRKRAGEIDPQSDIAHLDVTVSLGDLEEDVAKEGLFRGLNKAGVLRERGAILGAFLQVGGFWGCLGLEGTLQRVIHEEVLHGDKEDRNRCGGDLCRGG